MAKVEITNDTPSQQVVAQASAEVVITDAQGRSITLKKPGVLAQYRLVEIVGESAKNETYMRMILPLIYVSAIDGDAVHMPASKRELEALIQRLDEDGITAVSSGVMDNFGQNNPEADRQALKNS